MKKVNLEAKNNIAIYKKLGIYDRVKEEVSKEWTKANISSERMIKLMDETHLGGLFLWADTMEGNAFWVDMDRSVKVEQLIINS